MPKTNHDTWGKKYKRCRKESSKAKKEKKNYAVAIQQTKELKMCIELISIVKGYLRTRLDGLSNRVLVLVFRQSDQE